jgi:hypothetical protein
MPEFVVTDPSGKEHVVTAPEGASQEEVLAYAKQNFGSKEAPQQDKGLGDQIKSALNTAEPYVTGAVRGAVKGAIPTGMGILGGAVGGIAGSAVPGVGTAIGAGVGMGSFSALGEIANQELGITEPSKGQIVAAGLAPSVVQGVIGGARHVGGALLKAAGGRDKVADVAETLLKKVLAPTTTADELYKQVASKHANIPLPESAKVLQAMEATKGKLPTETQEAIDAIALKFKPWFEPVPGQSNAAHPITDVADAVQDLSIQAAAAYNAKVPDARLGQMITRLRTAIMDDAAKAGVPELAAASKLARREHAITDLAGVIRGANPSKHYQDMIAEKNSLFAGSFNDAEKKHIGEVLGRLQQVAPSGFAGVLGRAMLTSAGAGIGANEGGAPGAMAGGAVGLLTPEIAAFVLSRDRGRKFMERMLQGQAFNISDFTRRTAMFARGMMAEDAHSGDVARQVRASMRDESVSLEDKLKTKMKQSEQKAGVN